MSTSQEQTELESLKTVEQLLTGLTVAPAGACRCTGCQRSLRDGTAVTVYASRPAGSGRWELARLYCMECGEKTIRVPTLGTAEVLATAFLGVVSMAAGQCHRLCLTSTEVIDLSPLAEDRRP